MIFIVIYYKENSITALKINFCKILYYSKGRKLYNIKNETILLI